MYPTLTDRQLYIATQIVHMAHVSYCLGTGDYRSIQPSQEDISSTIEGIKAFIANPHQTPESQHNDWMKYKLSQGWTYGPTKDDTLKTHPCLVPYAELPAREKQKDIVFLDACRVALEVVQGNMNETGTVELPN